MISVDHFNVAAFRRGQAKRPATSTTAAHLLKSTEVIFLYPHWCMSDLAHKIHNNSNAPTAHFRSFFSEVEFSRLERVSACTANSRSVP